MARLWCRPVAVLVGSVGLLLAAAAPAAAHGNHDLPDARYYHSTITSVRPEVPGLDLSMIKDGASITLTNRTGRTVVVLGYTGEPYLRISPTGVDENLHSVSSRLNGSSVVSDFARQLTRRPQPGPPQWKGVSDRPTFTWHDHRMHWMAPQRSPGVAADPRNPHPVLDWTMDLSVDGRPVVVTGALVWLGEPLLTGLALALVVTAGSVLIAVVGLVILRIRISWRSPRQQPAVGGTIGERVDSTGRFGVRDPDEV
jgi:hypothetical protein